MKLFLILILALVISGCEIDHYRVVLVIDAKDYRSSMKWTAIREAGFREPYTMRVSDADGHPIPVFRFMHESQSLMLLEEDPIHISTPVIVEKKYTTFFLTISEHGKEVKKVRVDSHDLYAVAGGPTASVIPVDLK